MPNLSTREGRAEILNALVDKHGPMLEYLWGRWQDEKQYEDWKGYSNKMKEMFGDMFVKAMKRPFGVTLQIEGFPYQPKITVNSRSIGWSS